MLGKTLTGRYKIVKQLGGGGFSHTFIAEDGYLPDRPTCVIKQLKPASSQAEILKVSRELFDNEAKVLYRLGRHECIPSLLAHFEEDEEFFLAQELIEGDVLTQEIKRGECLGEQYTIDFLTDILHTLDFVHRQQVIHRDIKPSNLIRRASDKKIVLIDFGAVKEVSTQPISQLGHTSSLVIGSPGYMPNEQYSGKTMFASDIYAIGVISIQAMTGLLPNQIPEDQITSEFCWRDRAKVTPTLADVIDKMVRFDFRQRYQSANEVLEALQPLLIQSQAQTVFSKFKPLDLSELKPIASNESTKSPQAKLIDEVSDDLEMSEDPVRAKKLVCLVCTGILENDILIVAKIVFNATSKFYQQSPVSVISESISSAQCNPNSQKISQPLAYSVDRLVINAGSAQLIAPLNTSQNSLIEEPLNESLVAELPSETQSGFSEDELSLLDPYLDDNADIYAWVAHNINIDAQQMRLKKLLFYTYQDVWQSDLRQLNSIDWASLLRELVSFMPTFLQLQALLQEAVQRVSKPAEYIVIGNLLLTKLEPLYPDRNDANNLETIAPPISPVNQYSSPLNNQSHNKIPFDPRIALDLFDLRLELIRFTSSMRAKILLFSVLYYPFDPDRDNWHDLGSHRLDGLLRQLFYAYPSFEKAEKSVWQIARSLSEPSAYDQAASYILQVVKTLYDQLEAKLMLHPAEGKQAPSEDTDFTQPSALSHSNDDDTCQFA